MSKYSEDDQLENQKYSQKRWVGSDEELQFLPDLRKEYKQERKIASKTDRSKYKKTDLQKKGTLPKGSSIKGIKGRVLTIGLKGITVSSGDSQWLCQLKGALKKDKNRIKNLVAVGDFVIFEETSPTNGVIIGVEPRKSILSRADHLRRRKEQLIAANVDLVIIACSCLAPSFKPSLVDRYLIAAQKGGLQTLIVINKIDLVEKNEDLKHLIQEFCRDYTKLGFCIICCSTLTQEGINELCNAMKGKTSVFSGQSGVGKSSLINAITGTEFHTADVVARTQKGSHTTSSTQLIPLTEGGFCVDTPGIRSFGLWQLSKGETIEYFKEIFEIGQNCKYPGCTHICEPDCAVQKAVVEGTISPLRFESYLKILPEEGQNLY